MENLIGTTIGGCSIAAKIGQGGMGVVYKAHHVALDIPVAVKVLNNLSEMPDTVRRGLTAETSLLLRYGADVNARDGKGDTPLHYALREGASYMVSLLLEKGADPNIADHRGASGLAIAQSVDSQLEQMVRRYGGK
jgi:ankyrin repeat protein